MPGDDQPDVDARIDATEQFDRLYHHVSDLRAFFLSRAEGQEVDDFVNDVYVRAFRCWEPDRIQDDRRYLFRIARSVLFDVWRRRRVRRDYLRSERFEFSDVDLASPEQNLLDREVVGRFQAAVRRLPDRDRQIFQMTRIEKRPHREVAAELGLSVSSIEKYASRSRRYIIEAMQS